MCFGACSLDWWCLHFLKLAVIIACLLVPPLHPVYFKALTRILVLTRWQLAVKLTLSFLVSFYKAIWAVRMSVFGCSLRSALSTSVFAVLTEFWDIDLTTERIMHPWPPSFFYSPNAHLSCGLSISYCRCHSPRGSRRTKSRAAKQRNSILSSPQRQRYLAVTAPHH